MGEFDRIDVLVNNAGISTSVPAEETTLADWSRTLAVNLTGPFRTCREFGRVMLERGSESIVNVSSVAGLLGISDRAAYNASKYGLIGSTRTLAAEWGGRGVRVNAVCPGWVKVEMDEEDQEPAATPTRTSRAASSWAASPRQKTWRGPSSFSLSTAAGSGTASGRACGAGSRPVAR